MITLNLVASYSLGSITLLLPQQEAVHTPSDRRKFPALYSKVIASIVTFYCFYSISCWVAFGDNVKTIMTTR
jgi:proton-coupled amino acid transporter